MTRKKKTRSLKRIHNVKTGNVQKLKRAANSNRQTGKRVDKTVKSVYQKFLEENPEAKKQAVLEQRKAEAKKLEEEKANALRKDVERAEAEQRKAEKADHKLEKKSLDDDDIFDQFERGKRDEFY